MRTIRFIRTMWQRSIGSDDVVVVIFNTTLFLKITIIKNSNALAIFYRLLNTTSNQTIDVQENFRPGCMGEWENSGNVENEQRTRTVSCSDNVNYPISLSFKDVEVLVGLQLNEHLL